LVLFILERGFWTGKFVKWAAYLRYRLLHYGNFIQKKSGETTLAQFFFFGLISIFNSLAQYWDYVSGNSYKKNIPYIVKYDEDFAGLGFY